MNSKITIRNTNISDLDQIIKIDTEAFGTNHWSYKTFYNELNNQYSLYLSAEYNKDIIGYIGMWKVQNEGHITTMAVDVNYKRRHIADILLYNIINKSIALKIKWLTLEVRYNNIPAINLYKKFKFKQLGIRKKYYQDHNDDALVLWSENIELPEYLQYIEDIICQFKNNFIYADKLQYTNHSLSIN